MCFYDILWKDELICSFNAKVMDFEEIATSKLQDGSSTRWQKVAWHRVKISQMFRCSSYLGYRTTCVCPGFSLNHLQTSCRMMRKKTQKTAYHQHQATRDRGTRFLRWSASRWMEQIQRAGRLRLPMMRSIGGPQIDENRMLLFFLLLEWFLYILFVKYYSYSQGLARPYSFSKPTAGGNEFLRVPMDNPQFPG